MLPSFGRFRIRINTITVANCVRLEFLKIRSPQK